MIILAFDCATSLGYAVIEDGKVKFSGQEDFTPTKEDYRVLGTTEKKVGMETKNGMILRRFKDWLLNHDSFYNLSPDYIVWEKPFFRGEGSFLLIEMPAMIEEWALRHRFEIKNENYFKIMEPIPSTTVKLEIAGHGHAGKEKIVEAIGELTGIELEASEDDCADAIALGLCLWERLKVAGKV